MCWKGLVNDPDLDGSVHINKGFDAAALVGSEQRRQRKLAVHLALGGARTGPNYDADHVSKVAARRASKGLAEAVMIDCSHGNSLKNHLRQADVVDSMAEQLSAGSRAIVGAMIESHLVEGRQDYLPEHEAVNGQSITDACLSFEQTEPLLETLAKAQRARG